MKKYRKMIRMIGRILFILPVIFCFFLKINVKADDDKKVLFISSYSYDWESIPKQIDGIKETILDDVEIQYMFMDAKHKPQEKVESDFYNAIENKMSLEEKFDVIVLGDDDALNFALKYREEFFKDIPLVFEGINSEKKAREAVQQEKVAGIVEKFPIGETIEMAFDLYPKATQVVAITDDTISGQGSLEQFMDIRGAFEQLEFQSINVSEMTKSEIETKLSSYDMNTILLYLMFTNDKDNNSYTLSEGVHLVTNAASIPVFKADEIGIEYGLLGGNVVSFTNMGKMTGEMVNSILEGVSPEEIPLETVVSYDLFDKDAMDRFGINKKELPEDSIIINDSTIYWNSHFLQIAIVVIAVMFFCIFILRNYLERSKYKKLLSESQEKDTITTSLINSIPGGIAIYEVDGNEIKVNFFSEGVPSLCNRTRAQYEKWIENGLLQTVFDDDQKRVKDAVVNAIQTTNNLDIDFRLTTNNGGANWIHLSANKIRETDGKQIYYAVYTKLAKDAQMFRKIMDESSQALYVCDVNNYNILFANKEAFELAEEIGEVTETKCHRFLFGKEKPCEGCSLKDCSYAQYLTREIAEKTTGRTYLTRERLISWNGIPAHISYLMDDTERARNRERLQDLLNRVPGGIGIFELEDGIIRQTYLNDGYYNMLKVDSADSKKYIGTNSLDMIHPEDLPILRECIEEAEETGYKINTIFRKLNGDDEYIWTNLVAVRIEKRDGCSVYYCSYHDVSEMIRARDLIQESEGSLQAAIAHSDMMFWEYYPEQHMAIQGYKAQIEFGIDEKMENYPQSWIDEGLIHQDSIASLKLMYHDIDDGAESSTCDVKIKYANGYHWNKLCLTTIYGAEGKRIKVIGTAEDRDAYKDLEERFALTTSQLGCTTWTFDLEEKSIIRDTRTEDAFALGDVVYNVPQSLYESGMIHPNDVQIVKEMYDKLLNGEKNVSSISRWKRVGSNEYWWSKIIYTVIPNKDGKVTKAIGTSIDVSEQINIQKNFDKECARRETLERTILSTACFNLSRNYLEEYNAEGFDSFGIVTGISGSDFIQKTARQILDEKEKEKFIELFNCQRTLEAYKEGERSQTMEYLRLFADKQERFVSTTANVIENPSTGDILCFYYTNDIDKTRIHQIIMENTVDADAECIAYYDLRVGKSELVTLNKENLNLLDIEGSEEDSEYGLWEPLANVSKASENSVISSCKFNLGLIIHELSDKPVYSVLQHIEQEGKRDKFFKTLQFCYLDDRKNIIVFMCKDITAVMSEEQENQRKLQKALREAQQANNAKSDFLSRMSHDIRTPMNAIIGMTGLAYDVAQNPDTKKYIKQIENSSEYLLSLINDILDMSRIESGSVSLNYTEVDMRDIIDNIRNIMNPLVQDKRIDFIVDVDRIQYPFFRVDKKRWTQIIVNLLSNAVKFSDEEGKVELSAKDKKNELGVITQTVVIKDYGCGMSKEFLQRMWKPFEQEKNRFSDKYASSGLGLAICKNLVEQMGGTIVVESELEKGSTFTINMQLEECGPLENEEVKRASSFSTEVFADKNVLLVEDNEINTEIATLVLEKVGFHVSHAENGEIAVEMFKESEENYYDIILMDIRMPVMDGVEATKIIRSLPKGYAKEVPIIAMTADAFSEDIEKTISAGMNAHLSKPIKTKDLYSTLASYIK